MSSQSSQRLPRRNQSPSMKQGPLKATLPFSSLVLGSPTRTSVRKGSPSLSPTSQWGPEKAKRRSPDSRTSPERRSPSSPNFKVERPKPLRPSPTGVRYDSANQYLTGQWPRETQFHRIDTEEKSTQTPDEWEESLKRKHKRSASVGNGDSQLALYRQRLQRNSKENGKPSNGHRQSPIPGNHFVPPSAALYAVTASSKAIGIPNIPTRAGSSSRCSVSLEGLNQEIENFGLSTPTVIEGDMKVREQAPDGHRAPILELIRGQTTSTRSVDTQTPSGGYTGDLSTSASSSRSQSISPSFPMIPGNMDTSRPNSGRSESGDSSHAMETSVEGFKEIKVDECESPEPASALLPKNAFSPLPNKSYSFVREPPDGCEKVNITQENRLAPMMKEHLFFCPSKESQLVLKPSDRSAFCPPHYMAGIPGPGPHTTNTSAFILVQSQRTTIESQ